MFRFGSRPAAGVVRSRAGRGQARFGEPGFRVRAVWGCRRNSVGRFSGIAARPGRPHGGRSRISDRPGEDGQQGRLATAAQPVRGAKRELSGVPRRRACGPVVTAAVHAGWSAIWLPESAVRAVAGRRRTRAGPRWAGPAPPRTARLPRGEGHARARSLVHHPPQSCRRRDGLQGTHEIRRRLALCAEPSPTAVPGATERCRCPARRRPTQNAR